MRNAGRRATAGHRPGADQEGARRTPAMNDSSAAGIARSIRARERSCEEVVTEHLRRIDEVNPRLNAVVQRCSERALSEARSADRTLASGGPVGVLHGV